MKKILGITAVLALVLGVWCGVVMAANAQQSEALPKTQDVELQVNVHKWAKIEETFELMELDLTQPGTYKETYQFITVATNTKVTVSVSDSELSLVTPADEGGKGFTVSKDLPLEYDVVFRKDTDSKRGGYKQYTVEAGERDTRRLVFWAEWMDGENWYQLLAGEYKGSATVTVAASN